MTKTFKLSPSDLTFLWDECPKCAYLKIRYGVSRPRSIMPTIFIKIDSIMKKYFEGKSPRDIEPSLPSGRIEFGDRWVQSKVFKDRKTGNQLFIKGKTDLSSMVGTWWNHQIVKERKQISAISGRIINQKVKFLGKQDIQIDKKNYKALHFHFLSDDNKPLKEKKLNIHVWYDADTLLWIKSSYDKLGQWEYRLRDVSF